MAEKVEIVVEATDNASGGLKQVNQELASIGSISRADALRDLGAAGVDAFNAMAEAASEYVDIAAEAELVNARMEAQLRALGDQTSVTSGQINDLAEELSQISGFDDEDLVQAQTTLLRFGNMSEDQFERATRAATDLAAMTGQDLTSAFQQVGIALDTGKWGRLTRQVGDLTDSEKAALKAAEDAGDAMKAQEIILAALERKTNGAAEAIGDTWTGKLNIARVNADNFKQSIGDGVLGPLNQIPQGAIDAGVGISDFGKTIVSVAGPLANFAIVLNALKAGGAFAGIGAAFSGLSATIGGALTGLWATITAAFSGIAATVGGALAAITLPVWALIAAIVALIAVVVVFGEDAKKTFGMIAQIIGALLKRAVADITRTFTTFGTTITRTFTNIVNSARNFANSVMTSFQKLIDGARDWGRGIVEGLWDGIESGWTWLKDQISANMDSLLTWVKDLLGIGSPSRVWALEIGKPIAQGIGQGFGAEQSGLGRTIGDSLMPRNLAPAAVAAQSGPTVVLNLTATAVADRNYAAQQMVPLVREAMRRLNK